MVILILLFVLPKIILPKESIVLEYGQDFTLDKSDVFEQQQINQVRNFTYDLSSVKKDDSNLMAIGKHKIEVSYDINRNTFQEKVVVSIVDHTNPVFTSYPESIDIYEKEDLDLSYLFNASDLNDVTIKIDTSGVDFNQTGSYQAVAYASDAYHNTSSQSFTINIKALDIKNISTCNPNIKEPTIIDGIILVNKLHPLPCNYNPGLNKEAEKAFKQLKEEMIKQGFNIDDKVSAYRSFDYQVKTFKTWVQQDGIDKARTYSALPGYSEHQTGLAFDLFNSETNNFIQNDPESKWLQENAHKYGFIVRFTKDDERLTGYTPEPWHIRYVGDKALAIYESGLTLEEYLYNTKR